MFFTMASGKSVVNWTECIQSLRLRSVTLLPLACVAGCACSGVVIATDRASGELGALRRTVRLLWQVSLLSCWVVGLSHRKFVYAFWRNALSNVGWIARRTIDPLRVGGRVCLLVFS